MKSILFKRTANFKLDKGEIHYRTLYVSQLVNANLIALLFLFVLIFNSLDSQGIYQLKYIGIYGSYFAIAWIIAKTYFTSYVITNQRIIVSRGVFKKNINTIELYRIKDIKMIKPFLLRFFGLSNFEILTSQRSMTSLNLYGINAGDDFFDDLRALTERIRVKKGVREIDTN